MAHPRRRLVLQGLAGLPAAALALHARAARPPRKLGVALVGLGIYSRHVLAPALQLTEHCELRGIVTGSPHKIPEWQKQYRIPDRNVYSYETLPKVADNPDIDVIYIVTPPFLHARDGVRAAQAGKHVWCEKPMAMTVDECQSIIEACRRNKVKLSIGYRMQHEPNTRTIIEFAGSRPFGAIRRVKAEAGFRGRGTHQGDWRMDRDKGGGALYDMGVYSINAMRYATRLEPVAVSARFENDYPDIFLKADSTAFFDLEFPGGIVANGATSVTRDLNHLRVECERGWYELAPMQTFTHIRGRTSDGRWLDKPLANQQVRQMDNDALAILNDTPVMVPGADGLADIRVVRAVLRSAETGRRVEIG